MLDYILKTVFPLDKYFVVFFVTILISTYELISISENLIVINPTLSFLFNLIDLSNRLNKKAISYAAAKIEGVEIKAIDIKTEIIVKNEDSVIIATSNDESDIKE